MSQDSEIDLFNLYTRVTFSFVKKTKEIMNIATKKRTVMSIVVEKIPKEVTAPQVALTDEEGRILPPFDHHFSDEY